MPSSDAPSRATIVIAAVAVLAIAALAGGLILRLAPNATEFTLASMEADVAQRFPLVTHLQQAEFKTKLASGKPPLLVDVREDTEFNVSHLQGAIHIRPDIPIADAKAILLPLVDGREVVFYCSSGLRSSVVATEVQDDLIKSGATAVFNLRGGVFSWHNAYGALVDSRGNTDVVHPVSDAWGKLLDRRDKLRMTPQSSADQR